MDDNTKTIDKDQQALLAFVDDLLSQRQDLNIPEERRQDVRIAMLGEVNEHINQHLVRLLSSEGKKELEKLLDAEVSDKELDDFFDKKIPGLREQITASLADFRAAFLYQPISGGQNTPPPAPVED